MLLRRAAARLAAASTAAAPPTLRRPTPSAGAGAAAAQPLPLQRRWHGDDESVKSNPTVNLVFVRRDGTEFPVVAHEGESLLRVGQRYELEIEGACEASVACSTCHVILEPDVYGTLPPARENEEDMLDMAFGLTGTSRLGCQVTVTRSMEGTKVRLPKATRNFYVDGHKPKPH